MSIALRRKAKPAPPLVRDAAPILQTIHDLHGNSGASAVLHACASGSFVRKTAAGPAANIRLQSQAAKQNDLGRSGVRLPRILASGVDEAGLAFFDMEYVPGRTIANAVIDAAPFDRRALAEGIARLLWLFGACQGEPLGALLFHGKIDQIAGAAAARETCASIAHKIPGIAARLHGCDWQGIPQSPCHGDLTLENILIANRRDIVFIDCDEAFVSSFWLDLGKLFQDVSGHWCIRQLYAPGTPSVRRTGAVQKLDRLGADFRALAQAADPALPARLPQLAALGLFRALPYARTPAVAEFVCDRIGRVMDGAP